MRAITYNTKSIPVQSMLVAAVFHCAGGKTSVRNQNIECTKFKVLDEVHDIYTEIKFKKNRPIESQEQLRKKNVNI